MAVSGMQMMLKSLGLDPDDLKANVEGFMVMMKGAVEKVEANQLRIEGHLGRIESKLDMLGADPLTFKDSSRAIYEDGKHTGVILTDEKFPRPLYDGLPAYNREADETAIASNFDAVKQGGQDNGR